MKVHEDVKAPLVAKRQGLDVPFLSLIHILLSQKSYAVTSPDTVEIDGKEYKIQLSEDKTVLTMRPAFSFYGAKEVWYLRDPEK